MDRMGQAITAFGKATPMSAGSMGLARSRTELDRKDDS